MLGNFSTRKSECDETARESISFSEMKSMTSWPWPRSTSATATPETDARQFLRMRQQRSFWGARASRWRLVATSLMNDAEAHAREARASR